MNLIWQALWFVVAVSLLVTVHEFGHFWVARRLGFKVLRFSVGFVKPLVRRVAGAGRARGPGALLHAPAAVATHRRAARGSRFQHPVRRAGAVGHVLGERRDRG